MYDPALGRFLQTDPTGYQAGMNLYAYVGNDPINAIDPSGRCQWGSITFPDGSTVSFPPSGSDCDDGAFQDAISRLKDQSDNAPKPALPSQPERVTVTATRGTNSQSGAACSIARQHLFQIGELIEGGGDVIKLLSLAGGGVSLTGLVGGGLSGQPEVAIPSALGLKRAAQAYELGAFVSTIGVSIKSAADLNPTGITADILNDRIAEALGLGGFRKGLFSDLASALEDVKYSCGGH
jgi:hypothetical protein